MAHGGKGRSSSMPNCGAKCTYCDKDNGVAIFYSSLLRLCLDCHNNFSHKYQPFVCFLVKNKSCMKSLFNDKSIDDNTKGVMLGDLNKKNISKYEYVKNVMSDDSEENLLKPKQLAKDMAKLDSVMLDSNFAKMSLQDATQITLSWEDFGINKRNCMITVIKNFGYLVRTPRRDMS